MADEIGVRVNIGCNTRITSRLLTPVRYYVNGGNSDLLYSGQTTSIPLLNQNVNRIEFGQPVAIFTGSGSQVSASTTSLVVNGCDQSYQLREPDRYPPLPPRPAPYPYPTPVPVPSPYGRCSTDPQLTSIASQIRAGRVSERQLVNTVNGLSTRQINTLICIPDIDNAYLLELAVIYQLPALTRALVDGGANVCLTSDAAGRSIYEQLSSIGANASTPAIQQIIGIIVQAGGANCR